MSLFRADSELARSSKIFQRKICRPKQLIITTSVTQSKLLGHMLPSGDVTAAA